MIDVHLNEFHRQRSFPEIKPIPPILAKAIGFLYFRVRSVTDAPLVASSALRAAIKTQIPPNIFDTLPESMVQDGGTSCVTEAYLSFKSFSRIYRPLRTWVPKCIGNLFSSLFSLHTIVVGENTNVKGSPEPLQKKSFPF